jgi:hypothetical protein
MRSRGVCVGLFGWLDVSVVSIWGFLVGFFRCGRVLGCWWYLV